MTTSGTPTRATCALGIVLSIAAGCGGATPNQPNPTERTASESRGRRLELGIRLADGSWLELGDLRGQPVVVFVFATFDMVSQASLKALRPFVLAHPEVAVVGIASEPRATQLVEAWAYALDPPFPVGADPYGRVENGESVLGRIEKVPTYIFYDREGYERSRIVGYQTAAELDATVDSLNKAP